MDRPQLYLGARGLSHIGEVGHQVVLVEGRHPAAVRAAARVHRGRQTRVVRGVDRVAPAHGRPQLRGQSRRLAAEVVCGLQCAEHEDAGVDGGELAEGLHVPVGEVDHEAAEVLPGPLGHQVVEALQHPSLPLLPGLVSCITHNHLYLSIYIYISGHRYSMLNA